MMKRLALVVALLMMAGTARAVVNYYDFNGNVSADWNNPSNWYLLTSASQIPDGSTPTATVAPYAADQVMIRGGKSVTIYGGYTAYMGSTYFTFNGIGSALYRDDDGNSVWVAPSTVVLADPSSLLSATSARQNGQFDIGGYYGGTMIIKGGSFRPEMNVYIGDYGNLTYTGMKDGDGNQDPNYVGITNTGLLILDGGTITPCYTGTSTTSGTKARLKAGYRGGNGTFLFKSGLMNWGLGGTAGQGVQMNIAEGSQATGWYPDPNYCGKTTGYMEMSGGSWNTSENMLVGYHGGKGKYVQTGGTAIIQDLDLGYQDLHDTSGWFIPENHDVGVANISGSTTYLECQGLGLGFGNSEGTLNVSNGATVKYTKATASNAELSVGRSVVSAGGSMTGNGVGVINISSGTLQYKPALGNTTRGTVRFGWTWDNRQYITKDPNYNAAGLYSRGELHQTGGVVLFEAGGTVADAETVVSLGQSYSTGTYPYGQPRANSTGILDITGGSFMTAGKSYPVIDPESGGTIAWNFIQAHVLLAPSRECTGIMNVGRNAYVSIDGNFLMKPYGDANEPNSLAKLTVDFDATKNGRVNVHGLVNVADTLVVNSAGYRPREGDKMVVIRSTDPNSVYFTASDFATISTNITLGKQGSLAFFRGNKNAGDYEAIFQGLTSGDANGDHSVDGGDLALMGGSWNQSGKVWAQADFNGDGAVDGGDLALMGGNWGWALSAAPSEGVALPEPATLAMLGLGALVTIRRRRA